MTAICCGLQFTSGMPWTAARSPGLAASLPGRDRGLRASARAWAACGRQPPPGRALRRTSRLTVEGLRPSPAAMARRDAPSRSRPAMQIRSSSLRYRPETGPGGTTVTGGAPLCPVVGLDPFRQRVPVR
jgi:hypothetical protein